MNPPSTNKLKYLYILGLGFLISLGFILYQQGFSVHTLNAQVADLGPIAPLIWTLCLWILLPLMLPVSVMTALSGLAFGPAIGFTSAFFGVVGGGWISFLIARYGGKSWVEKLVGSHSERLEPHLNTHGLWGVLYLRMLPLPYVPLSYLAGLTRLRFWPYAIGTAIGCIPGVLVNSVIAGTLGEVWAADEGLAALLQPRTYWALGVVAFSLVGPFIIESIRRRKRKMTPSTDSTSNG